MILSLRCVTQHLSQTHSHPSTVSKAVDIGIQHIMELVDELDMAVMGTTEGIAVLNDHHKLIFREADDREDTEEGIIMVEGAVGMVEVVGIRATMGCVTLRGRSWFDGMAVVAVVVDGGL